MKITKIGWCPKSLRPVFIKQYDGIQIDRIFCVKGRKNEWPPCDWPPKKVKISIETID